MPVLQQSRNSPVDRAEDSRIDGAWQGHHVILVGSAEEGLDMLRRRTFDVVLTDREPTEAIRISREGPSFVRTRPTPRMQLDGDLRDEDAVEESFARDPFAAATSPA